MKKIILNLVFFCSFFFSNTLASQNFDDAFLKSLPASIQQEFQEVSDDTVLDSNFNERPDTRIKKIESGIDAINKQVLSLEMQLNRESGSDGLQIFGSNFFDSYQSSFAPINELNFAADYVLDIGDVLNIQSFGSADILARKQKVIVARDGSINIPRIGKINVAGMPYEEAISNIKDFAKSKYLNVNLYINLEEARDMNILLVGNAVKPGIYTLPGGSNILSVLHAAGGLSKGGSFRSVIHKRNNNILQEIDLYDVLINGNLYFKTPLRSGDSVVVNPSQRLVAISGGINTPAIYELKDNEELDDLVNLAKGFSLSSADEILISTRDGDSLKIALDELADVRLNHGDSVKVSLYSPNPKKILTAKINGAVNKPGEYSFTEGTTLHELIAMAGGYSETAYPYGGALYRKRVAQIQQDSFNKTYNSLINFYAANAKSPLAASPNLSVVLAELKESQFKGRVSAEFSQRKIDKEPSLDTILVDGDEILIPQFTSDVYVTGDVMNPGGRRYSSELKARDYILQSGGLGRLADGDRIIVIKPNGDAEVIKSKLYFSMTGATVYPGSTIFVPKEIGKLDGIQFTATLAPIVSSLALSLASLNSIN